MNQNYVGGLLGTQTAGSHPGDSDLADLGYGLRIYLSNKFPGMLMLLVGNHTERTTGLKNPLNKIQWGVVGKIKDPSL